MERDGEGTVSSQTQRVNNGRSISPGSVRTGSDPFLVTCRLFSFVTALAAILCIVVNVYSAVRSFTHEYDVFDGIFRCYAVVIAVIVVVAETEWGFFIKFWKAIQKLSFPFGNRANPSVLEFSAGRGMLQIFVAVMTRAYPEDYGQRNDLILLRNIASYFLLTCGAIYIISGLLCFGFIKRARQAKEISREQAINDLQAGHRNGLYRYHSGPFRSGSIRDGMGYIEPVHGTERYHDLVPVYRYRFIPVHSGSVPVRSGPGPVPVNPF
ncbi:hypothetical protein MTR67_006045 [Solanum verrucosum]|uniref:Uncharacterized protein n=1 Tax=Solanum verrucosum TaxID=315347 RepID=A0AAF0Q0Q6_SOLVR|nr:hypothetical protein MTR67_006045 [Solanum verrucosum]